MFYKKQSPGLLSLRVTFTVKVGYSRSRHHRWSEP